MTVTYTFTVRATDNVGAFADRTFSIDVANTVADRVLIGSVTGAAGLGRSVTGDATTYTFAPGTSFSFDHIEWCNNRWIAHRNATLDLRYSLNGIDFVTYTPTVPAGITRIRRIKYRNGRLYGIGLKVLTPNTTTEPVQFLESTDDGFTWTKVGSGSLGADWSALFPGIVGVVDVGVDFEFDPDFNAGNGRFVLLLNGLATSGAFTQFGARYTDGPSFGNTWNTMLPTTAGQHAVLTTAANIGLVVPCRVYRFNGYWFMNGDTASANTSQRLWVSVDGANWSQIVGIFTPTASYNPIRLVFDNGYLYAAIISYTGAGVYIVNTLTRFVTRSSGAAAWSSGSIVSNAAPTVYGNTFASYNGRKVFAGNSGTPFVSTEFPLSNGSSAPTLIAGIAAIGSVADCVGVRV